jgi:pectate lyase C
MRKLLIAAALIAAAATAYAATNRPSGFTTICKIGESCTVNGATNVAFGASGQFVFKILSGTFTCSVATFGSDPLPSKSVKECSVNLSASPAPNPTPTPTPTPPPPSGGGGITGATCVSTGNTTINATVRVTSGTMDGGCRTFNPGSGLGDGSQDEGQDPAFRVENGATLRNVILGNNGVDGVHFYNGGNLQNFRWTNVGEDAFTIKSSGTVNVSGVTGVNSEDKFAQEHFELHRRQRREVPAAEWRHHLPHRGYRRPLPDLQHGRRHLPHRQFEQHCAPDQQPPAQFGHDVHRPLGQLHWIRQH